MDVKQLVPKNKHDIKNIEKLYQLPDNQMKKIIYDLLEWTQDYNWPVAKALIPVLIERENLVFPYIKSILNSDDIMWKYWVMDLLIPHFSKQHKEYLKNDILKLINDQNEDEDTEEIRKKAIELFHSHYDNI